MVIVLFSLSLAVKCFLFKAAYLVLECLEGTALLLYPKLELQDGILEAGLDRCRGGGILVAVAVELLNVGQMLTGAQLQLAEQLAGVSAPEVGE